MSIHGPAPARVSSVLRSAARRRGDAHAQAQVFLVPGEGGWSLLTRDGATVVSGAGAAGRRRCLEYARAHGILTVLS